MRRWGCLGLVWGTLAGLALVGLLVFITRPPAIPAASPPPTIPPDAVIYVSERTISRLAADAIQEPVTVNFEKNGVMQVTTAVPVRRWKPVVQAEILLSLQGARVVSQLRWVKMGFLTVPATWLPDNLQEKARLIGPAIKAQVPPDFSLVGLISRSDGLEFQVKWIGSP
jgi:hypothetical protein